MQDKVSQIFLERVIKTVEEENKLPWERPFTGMYAFNYFSMYEYTGINRWLLPPGEYMTANQIRTYNKEHGTKYLFQKGIKWFPVFFCKDDKKQISRSELPSELQSSYTCNDGYIGWSGFYWYESSNGSIFRCKKVRRYYEVADRTYFADENGNVLPSKAESGEVVMNYSEPDSLIGNYCTSEGIGITRHPDGGYYERRLDVINIPEKDLFKSTGRYYSTWFHEVAHSTGHESRLNRVGVSMSKDSLEAEKDAQKEHNTRKYTYSKEECVAELCCALLCNEANIQHEGLDDEVYKNHVAYVQSWIQYFKSNKDDIITVMSEAEKAYKYVLSKNVSNADSGAELIGG